MTQFWSASTPVDTPSLSSVLSQSSNPPTRPSMSEGAKRRAKSERKEGRRAERNGSKR